MSDNSSISLWQSSEWEFYQKALGNKVIRIGSSLSLLILYPLFFDKYWGYIPRSPTITKPEDLEELIRNIQNTANTENLIFTKIDTPDEMPEIKSIKHKTSHSFQPEASLILDLEMSEAELLSQMKRKGRYNIKISQEKGVRIEMAKNEKERKEFLAIFTELMKETTRRNSFSGHNHETYRIMLDQLQDSEIMIAFLNNEALAAGIFIFRKMKAIYYYGASTQKNKSVMAPYLLQWEAIREAKKRGCRNYDFLGIAPENAPVGHPWRGITQFKKKFGGEIIQYPPSIDLIHRPFWYQIYRSMKVIQKMFK